MFPDLDMFPDLERFVAAHRPCGKLSSDVGAVTPTGYAVRLACAFGATFGRWVTPNGVPLDRGSRPR